MNQSFQWLSNKISWSNNLYYKQCLIPQTSNVRNVCQWYCVIWEIIKYSIHVKCYLFKTYCSNYIMDPCDLLAQKQQVIFLNLKMQYTQ